jgi:hypothetical protein
MRIPVVLTAALAILGSDAAAAQEPEPSQSGGYYALFGTGSFSAGSRNTKAINLPLTFGLRDLEERKDWGLRLKVPITFGITDVDLDALDADDFQTVSVLPTAELDLPTDSPWTLTPYMGLGVGHEFAQNYTAWVGTAGVKLLSVQPLTDRTEVALGTGARYGFDLSSDGSDLDGFGRLELAADLRHATRASASGHFFQPGLYSRAYFYWDPVTFEASNGGTVSVETELEIGLSFGTAPTFEVFGIGLPRTYLGYRGGDGIRGIRLTFGELL